MSRLNFGLEKVATGSRARAATFRTLHNEVRTPLFMPVGTRATVKAQTVDTLQAAGSQILLANTYHLLIRPGAEVFRHFGGIHRFMKWPKSVLTDSGGFQIFSLHHAREMKEEGAAFHNYHDGTRVLLTPELSIDMQKAIGSDIMMVLDQCVPSTSERAIATQAMHLTHRWAKRSLEARGDSPQALFGIVQGACFPDLRRESAAAITELPFDGFAIGGLAVGESKSEREDHTELTADLLPVDRPRYLMGVGTPIDLLEAVHRGVDLFDCILPTALAQQGVAFTTRGQIFLRRGVYQLSDQPLEPGCECPTCLQYSRGYLHHLVKCKEILGWHLVGVHNLHFYHRLMSEMRQSILADQFSDYYKEKRETLALRDEENPMVHPKRKRRAEPRARTLGDYEIHVSSQGHSNIKQISSGEIMHALSDPQVEARRVYVEQAGIERRVREGGEQELIIWDVGLGAATNAMATIRAIEAIALAPDQLAGAVQTMKPVRSERAVRPVRIISFENDLDSLRLAASFAPAFPHLHHGAPGRLLEHGHWRSQWMPLNWELLEGDFLDRMDEAPTPDLIYFDPFSFKTDSALWTMATFRRIYDACVSKSTELFTYSASTAVRAALLGSGFYVAQGVPTPPKDETTIALMPESVEAGVPHPLLGQEWLARWERSGSKFPSDLPNERQAEFEKMIRTHPQFRLQQV